MDQKLYSIVKYMFCSANILTNRIYAMLKCIVLHEYFSGISFNMFKQPKTYSSSVYKSRTRDLAVDGKWSIDSALVRSFRSFRSYIEYDPWWTVVLDRYYDIDSVLIQTGKLR